MRTLAAILPVAKALLPGAKALWPFAKEDTLPCNAQAESDRGFLLIEAIAALAILSFAIVVILQFSQASSSTQRRAEMKITATLEARTTLAKVGTTLPLRAGESTLALASGNSALLTITRWPDPGTAAQSQLTPDSAFKQRALANNIAAGTKQNSNALPLYLVTVTISRDGKDTLSTLQAVKYAPAR